MKILKARSNTGFFFRHYTMQELYKLFKETSGVCTDTRNIKPNALFVALKGENFNGNRFAEKSIKQGCKYAIVDELEYANLPNVFYVPNALTFLQNLASLHRSKFNIPVIGITGSNGKTSTKELILTVLSSKYKTLATEGNLNNHIGVPLTLLKLTQKHEIAIIEMGANQPKDIADLCQITSPTHGIITNIGKAHLEGFGDLKGVITTKKALYDSLIPKNGVVFYNNDDKLLGSLLNDLTINIPYGQKNGSITGELVSLNPFINMKWRNVVYESDVLSTKMIGKYNFYNFLAAICIGNHFEISSEQISNSIIGYAPQNKRSQIVKTDKNLLIVDCYNANPTSMQLALESFNEFEHSNKLVILGDMLELGSESLEEHEKTINYCKKEKLKHITVGPIFKSIKPECAFEDVMQLKKELESVNKCAVLLKGSRGIQLEKLIEFL